MLRQNKLLGNKLLVAVFAVAALAPLVYADVDSHVRIVRLSYVEGDAQMDAGMGAGFQNATMNVPVVQGDRLRTGEDGRVEVQFEDGGTARLAPNSEMTFAEMGLMTSGATVTSISLDEGEAEFNIASHHDNEFTVSAGGKEIRLRHSSRFRITVMNSDPLEIGVWKGEVGVRNPSDGELIAVKKGETFALDLLDSGAYTLNKGVDTDSLDDWSDYRENFVNASASKPGYPYQYGVGDMNYYGQYQDLPGYGSLWQPYGVGLDWDPFMNGYWNYSPGFGYLWISSYPWGWMPYRYGQWVFINGRGWFWEPGLWNSGWHNIPPVVNPPQTFHNPVPPILTAKTPGTSGIGSPGLGLPQSGSPRANPGGSGGVLPGAPVSIRRIITEEDLQGGARGGAQTQYILGRPIVAGKQVEKANPAPASHSTNSNSTNSSNSTNTTNSANPTTSRTSGSAPGIQRTTVAPARSMGSGSHSSMPAPSMSGGSMSSSHSSAPASTGGKH